MNTFEDAFDLGRASVNLTSAVAGDYASLKYTYTAGHPVDDSGCIKIAFRFAGDFGVPQFSEKESPNYTTIRTTGDCRIEPRWDSKGNTRPWGRSLYLKVTAGYLNTGDTVVVSFGDTSYGSPGWRMQTFREKTFEFKTLVDPIATYQFKELPKSPHIQIKPGKPARAICIAPSQLMENQKFTYFLKLEDRWGNPVSKPRKLTHPGLKTPGVHRLTVTDEKTGLQAVSNPIQAGRADTAQNHWWADFHGQSEETIGSNTIMEYFTFARDYSLLNIAAHQGNDFQISDEFWGTINSVTKEFNNSGSFVTYPGYEWSGNTPLGGDRNVYFGDEGGIISRSCVELLPDKTSRYKSSPTATALFSHLKSQRRLKPFVFAHVGGRYADMRMHDPECEIAAEVHSAWGTFEWLVWNALKKGYRIGICANSDGHKGRPGASYPGGGKFGSYGGLTCVLAEKLDRQCITDALFQRHFYATTGNRALIDVQLTTASGKKAMMGDVIKVGEDDAALHVNVTGTASIESVDVFNGCKIIRTLTPYGSSDLGRRIKVMWSGAEVEGRARMTPWDGNLTIKGNKIESFQPVNFWNPDEQPSKVRRDRIEWKSVTTGGACGVILTLARAKGGTVNLKSTQKNLTCSLDTLKSRPRTWKCGGLEKKVQIHRLPDSEGDSEFSFSLGLKKLHPGDNPIYIRVTQQDGHIAWTSPVYAVV
jgi:hypothetical protein